jgi:hypothetical protein
VTVLPRCICVRALQINWNVKHHVRCASGYLNIVRMLVKRTIFKACFVEKPASATGSARARVAQSRLSRADNRRSGRGNDGAARVMGGRVVAGLLRPGIRSHMVIRSASVLTASGTHCSATPLRPRRPFSGRRWVLSRVVAEVRWSPSRQPELVLLLFPLVHG